MQRRNQYVAESIFKKPFYKCQEQYYVFNL